MLFVTPPRRLLLLTAIAVVLGFAGGGAAWVLLHLISLLTNLALLHRWSVATPVLAGFHPGWPLYAVAVAGAIAVSLLAKWSPVIRGHGIPEAMEAVLTKQSRVAPRTAIAKPISAAVAIGTGAPFGAEGPIIVTGGSIGSLLGQVIPVSASERKILLASGAAAGMSATFGAPLAAVVLAVELLVFEFSMRALVPLVVSTAIAGGMHAALFGHGPLFQVPVTDLAGLEVLPAFAIVGLTAGLLATVISRGLFLVEHAYRRLPVSEFWHPVIGAIGFATVGLFVPRCLGVGYDVIDDLLNARLAVGTAAAIAVAKLIAWWLALGSQTSGGTLAPILMIGAAFGTVLGNGLNHALPGPDIALGTFAIVAMAATFGASTQATFSAIVFVFELTRDYNVILPLMLATVLADLVYSSANRDSLMTEKLRRRGLHVTRHYSADPFATTRVDAIMTTPVESLSNRVTVAEAHTAFLGGGHSAFPIVEAETEQLLGMISRRDLLSWTGGEDQPALLAGRRRVPTVGPADPAQAVLLAMVDEHVEHVPVVDQYDRVVGICTRTDLLNVRRRQLAHEVPERRQPAAANALRSMRPSTARRRSSSA
ncbi:MAG: chloride channel protein [Acidimicrobiia bacterium]